MPSNDPINVYIQIKLFGINDVDTKFETGFLKFFLKKILSLKNNNKKIIFWNFDIITFFLHIFLF